MNTRMIAISLAALRSTLAVAAALAAGCIFYGMDQDEPSRISDAGSVDAPLRDVAGGDVDASVELFRATYSFSSSGQNAEALEDKQLISVPLGDAVYIDSDDESCSVEFENVEEDRALLDSLSSRNGRRWRIFVTDFRGLIRLNIRCNNEFISLDLRTISDPIAVWFRADRHDLALPLNSEDASKGFYAWRAAYVKASSFEPSGDGSAFKAPNEGLALIAANLESDESVDEDATDVCGSSDCPPAQFLWDSERRYVRLIGGGTYEFYSLGLNKWSSPGAATAINLSQLKSFLGQERRSPLVVNPRGWGFVLEQVDVESEGNDSQFIQVLGGLSDKGGSSISYGPFPSNKVDSGAKHSLFAENNIGRVKDEAPRVVWWEGVGDSIYHSSLIVGCEKGPSNAGSDMLYIYTSWIGGRNLGEGLAYVDGDIARNRPNCNFTFSSFAGSRLDQPKLQARYDATLKGTVGDMFILDKTPRPDFVERLLCFLDRKRSPQNLSENCAWD